MDIYIFCKILKKQISKVLHFTIPLPFNLNNPIAREIFKEQSPTYSKSSKEPSLFTIPKEMKTKLQKRWQKLIKKYYIV